MKVVASDAATVPSWGFRLVGVEGLRAVAALSVVVGHVVSEMAPASKAGGGVLWRILSPAAQGLSLFFVLSGFLLFRPFVTGLLDPQRLPHVGRFMFNRLVRIFPGYWAVLLVTSFWLGVARLSSQASQDSFKGAGRLPASDLAWCLPLVQTLTPSHVRTGLGAAWSLTVEFCFYVVLAIVGLSVTTRSQRGGWKFHCFSWIFLLWLSGTSGKIWLVAATAGMSEARKYQFEWGHTWSAVLCRSLLLHADLFAYGMAVAVVYVGFERGLLSLAVLRYLRLSMPLLVISGIGAASVGLLGPFQDTAAAIACCGILLLTILPTRRGVSLLARLLEQKFAKYLGLVSYGIYLWHVGVIWWLQRRHVALPDNAVGFAGNLLVVVALSVFLSSLTYWLIERPALRFKLSTDVRLVSVETGLRSSHSGRQ